MNAKEVNNQEGLVGWSSRLVIRYGRDLAFIHLGTHWGWLLSDQNWQQSAPRTISFTGCLHWVQKLSCRGQWQSLHCSDMQLQLTISSQTSGCNAQNAVGSLAYMPIIVSCICRHHSRLNKSFATMLRQAIAADDYLRRNAVKSAETLCNNHNQNTYQEGVTALNPGKRRCACNAGRSWA